MAAGADVPFACTCGQVTGRLAAITPSSGARVVCHCASCRRADILLCQPDPTEGVALYQTTPDRVVFDSGQDRLALMLLSPKGLYRWHAACCGAPLFNTMADPGFAFASLHVARVADPAPLGPVRGHVNVRRGDTRFRNSGLAGLMVGILWRSAACRLSGRWKHTPFFELTTRQPVATPVVVARDQDGQAG